MLKRWNLQNADRKAVYAISTAIIILLAALVVTVALIGQEMELRNRTIGTHSDLSDRFSEVPAVEYKGAYYRPYENITNILVIGVDKYSDTEDLGISFRNGGQGRLLAAVGDQRRYPRPSRPYRSTGTPWPRSPFWAYWATKQAIVSRRSAFPTDLGTATTKAAG